MSYREKPPKPTMQGYITEQQTVDPLRPVPWAGIMKACGFGKRIAGSPFVNIAVAREESMVPIVDMACYPSHSLFVVKKANPETHLSGFHLAHFRDILAEAIAANGPTLSRTTMLHFLFIRPEPGSELSRRVWELMGPPTAAPEGKMKEIRREPGQMNDFLSLIGTDSLIPITQVLASYKRRMRNRVSQSIKIGR